MTLHETLSLRPEWARLPDCPEKPFSRKRWGLMEVLTSEGDTKKRWDRNNPEQVEDARKSWEFLVKEKRYTAFAADPKTGEKAGPMKEFDPSAESMILTPPMVAG